MALVVETTGLGAGGGETSHLSVSVLRRADPVNARVVADAGVVRVNQDNLVEFEAGVLTNPVAVQNAQVGGLTGNTLLSDVLVGLGLLLLADTHVDGLTVDDTLTDILLAATTADTDAVDDVALSTLVTESVSLVAARWAAASVDGGQLTVLPSADSQHKAHEV